MHRDRYPYRKLQHSRYHRRTAQPGGDPALAGLPVAEPVSGAPRVRRRRMLMAVIPLVLLTVLAALVVPVFLRARTAYGQIFVTPMARLQVTQNEDGTPVVVASSGTAVPTASATTPPSGSAGLPAATVLTPTPNPLAQLPNWDKKERVNVLLLGVDSNAARQASGEPPLSDTIIVVSINPATKTVSMLSIPRDLLVTIPNFGQDKINAAFGDGERSGLTGPALVRATIEYNFGIPIHYYAEVDLGGFQKIVDTMGGVTIDVQAPLKDDQYPGDNFDYTRFVFHTGLQHLDGADALHYARSRHDDNDFARGDRQQQVLKALREQAVSLNLVGKAPQLLDELAGTFRTDLSPTQVLALAKLAGSMSSDNIKSYNMLDVTTVQWLPGQPYYLIPQWPAVQAMVAEINSR